MLRSLLPAILLLVPLALAAPAGAATVSVGGTTVNINAPDRERNDITVRRAPNGGISVRDTRSPLSAGAGCTQNGPDRATCGTGITDVTADLGPLNDKISLTDQVPVRAVLRGGSENDRLRGGPRNDLLIGGSGPRDAVSYSGRPGNVRVTLNFGGADDGLAGEGDEVLETERAIGGNGFDELIGDGGPNLLWGGFGDDRLDGGDGADVLAGNRGQDLLQGGTGNDTFTADRTPDGSDALQGGTGRDRADYSRRSGNVVVDPDGFADDGDRPGPTLTFTGVMPTFLLMASPERDNVLPDVESVRSGAGADVIATANSGGSADGGPGTDVVYGGPGADRLQGNAGFDRVVARDGRRDQVRCGSEVDRAWIDPRDLVDFDCEQRARTFAPRVVPVARTLEDGGLRVRAECPPTAFVRCQGFVRAKTVRRVRKNRRARLGRVAYGLVPGATEEVVIRFDRKARRIVRRFAPLRVRLSIGGRDETGDARPSSTRIVLRG